IKYIMFKINKSLTIFSFLAVSFSTAVFGQQNYKAATVAFYNIENLFDTEISAGYIDGTLSPTDPNYHISINVNDIPNYDTESFKGDYTYENISGKKIIRPLILQDEFSPSGKKVWTEERYNQKVKNISHVIAQLGKEETQTAHVIVGLCEIENRKTVEDIANSPEIGRAHV